MLPAVLYGVGIDNLSLKVSEKEFERVYEEAGESSLIDLRVDDKKYQVLIHDIAQDSVRDNFLHVDFYHPSSHKKVIVEVSLIFEGEEKVQKNLGGNLIKEIQAVEVKGLPQDLPKEIKVDITSLRDIGDKILIKDLKIPENIEVLNKPEEVVVVVTALEKFEEEIPVKEEKKPVEEKPTEEKVEEGESK